MNINETKPNVAREPQITNHKLERNEQSLPDKGDNDTMLLSSARKVGLACFDEVGLPTLRDENWRFTNVAPIDEMTLVPALKPAQHGITEKALNHFPFTALAGSQLVFVNGHFAPELSSIAELPAGAKVMNLAAALDTETALVEQHLYRHIHMADNVFSAINTAHFQDGAFIYVPANQVVAEPIHLLFVSTAKENGATAHPRNLIVAESNSQVTIIESYVSLSDVPYFTNSVTTLVAEDNAVLEHLKYQDENQQAFHIATIATHSGRASNLVTHSISLGAKLSRTNIYATLAGEGSECILNGLYLTRDEQLADHFMIVEHAQPHCDSHEYFNGILADKSKGVFHGRILVRPDAQKTDAKQTNKNLLLSDHATADTKPQLEIYADDVKCTHGATIGQLNDESIFYLSTRGIPRAKARRMLIHAFAGEIIDRVRCTAVRQELDQLVWNRVEQNQQIEVNP